MVFWLKVGTGKVGTGTGRGTGMGRLYREEFTAKTFCLWRLLIGLLAQGGDGFFIGAVGAEFGSEAKNISRKRLVQ